MAGPLTTLNEQTLRISLGTVIQMMNSQAPDGHKVAEEHEWPGIGWAILQDEAKGTEREKVAEGLGVSIEDIDSMVSGLMATEDQALAESLWQAGIVALRTAAMTSKNIIATTWDQVEALAIEKVAQSIQNLPGNKLDPMQMAQIAAMANKAVRRHGGELGGRGAPAGVSIQTGNSPMEVELQSGEVGSITLRFGASIIQQLQEPSRVIEGVANKPPTHGNREMLKLKEIRGAIESADMEAAQEEEAFAASVMAKVNQIKDRQAEAKEKFKIDELFDLDSKDEE